MTQNEQEAHTRRPARAEGTVACIRLAAFYDPAVPPLRPMDFGSFQIVSTTPEPRWTTMLPFVVSPATHTWLPQSGAPGRSAAFFSAS
ncbi:MAG TPA: hypothetical protein VF041_14415 [Gemmatimonadaceae bacterium]